MSFNANSNTLNYVFSFAPPTFSSYFFFNSALLVLYNNFSFNDYIFFYFSVFSCSCSLISYVLSFYNFLISAANSFSLTANFLNESYSSKLFVTFYANLLS